MKDGVVHVPGHVPMQIWCTYLGWHRQPRSTEKAPVTLPWWYPQPAGASACVCRRHRALRLFWQKSVGPASVSDQETAPFILTGRHGTQLSSTSEDWKESQEVGRVF